MRKIIEFDAETFDALTLLARDSMSTLQELSEEAFRDLLKKRGRPTSLKQALRGSLKAGKKNTPAPPLEGARRRKISPKPVRPT
jgi:hypothetical protein